MNNKKHLSVNQNSKSSDASAALDSLFSEVRQTEPLFNDQNFQKVVVNRLPARVQRVEKRSRLFDVVGLLVGLLAFMLLFDINSLIAMFVDLIPESVSLTLTNIGMVFSGIVGLAISAWWTTEKVIQ